MPTASSAPDAVRLDPREFEKARAARGLSCREIARAGRISHDTLTRLRQGRPVQPQTLKRLERVLQRYPVLAEVSTMLLEEGDSDAA